MKYIKPLFEFENNEKSNLEKLYNEIRLLAYILKDENLQVYTHIYPALDMGYLGNPKIEVVYQSVDSVTGELLQDRMDAIQEFYDRCSELCDEYNFIFSRRNIVLKPMGENEIHFISIFPK